MDAEAQQEELQVFSTIYPDEFHQLASGFELNFHERLELRINYPSTYPSQDIPVVEFLNTQLSTREKELLLQELDQLHRRSCGQVYLYEWIERLRSLHLTSSLLETTPQEEEQEKHPIVQVVDDQQAPVLEIHSGEKVVVKKSIFQAHLARITTTAQVPQMLAQLLGTKKIAKATHNIMAYRVVSSSGLVAKDNDDDGETAAGSKLAHLLDLLHVENVIVVVTRWYGGIHLGPDRFKLINNCARELLTQHDLIRR